MQQLFDFIRRYRREDGSELCETFIRAPKRRTDPAYYEVVSDPIDMLRIQQKLKTEEYADLDELKGDFVKLFNNAFAYYKKGTSEHRDATELHDLFNKALGNNKDIGSITSHPIDSEFGCHWVLGFSFSSVYFQKSFTDVQHYCFTIEMCFAVQLEEKQV